MRLTEKQKNEQIDKNEQEYGLRILGLNFPEQVELERADEERKALLDELQQSAQLGCSGTKLDVKSLSPGCRICTEGKWSCLFISGKCNCRCFYCPTAQNELGVPTTNTIEFHEPEEYIEYLQKFGFAGVSISGGEPLLTPERSLAFIRAVKAKFGSAMHVWLYTNGTLVQRNILMQLADAGLDEIRFDIGATSYDLKYLQLASGVFPTLTVEIPAVPDDEEMLKGLLYRLKELNVHHLNLHQLRLTPYNYDRIQPREYRFLHGEKVTVLDSELTALRVLQQSIRDNIGLPVNYCSFPYKNRFQSRANRRTIAEICMQPWESLTENGFIRSLFLAGTNEQIDRQIEIFSRARISADLWNQVADSNRLAVHPSLWSDLDLKSMPLCVEYSAAVLKSTENPRKKNIAVELSSGRSIYAERDRVFSWKATGCEEARLFAEIFFNEETSLLHASSQGFWDEIFEYEKTREGLAEYF